MTQLSKSTINIYTQNIQRLEQYNINFKNITNVDHFVDSLRNIKNITDSGIRTYLCAVLWYLKQHNVQHDAIQPISQKISSISQSYTEKYDKNILSDKEKSSYLDWQQILNVFDTLYSKRLHSQTAFKKCISLAFYVLFPPRRILDYSNMIAVQNLSNTNDAQNFFVIDQQLFIFSNYKNSKVYGQQTFNVPHKLYSLLLDYTTKYNLLNKPLIGSSESQLSNKIIHIFLSHTNTPASVNTLRHSFINFMSQSKLLESTEQRKLLALQMGHSHHIQQDLYRKSIS